MPLKLIVYTGTVLVYMFLNGKGSSHLVGCAGYLESCVLYFLQVIYCVYIFSFFLFFCLLLCVLLF